VQNELEGVLNDLGWRQLRKICRFFMF